MVTVKQLEAMLCEPLWTTHFDLLMYPSTCYLYSGQHHNGNEKQPKGQKDYIRATKGQKASQKAHTSLVCFLVCFKSSSYKRHR